MEYLKEIINWIPQILMYFIPGYITLEIKRGYRQESKCNDRDLILLSIVYSFIIGRIAFLIGSIYSFISKIDINMVEIIDKEWAIILYLIIAIIFGYIIAIAPDTKLATLFRRKLLRSNVEPYSNVWNVAMRNPKGAWARVYLEEGKTVYLGKLLKYTCDPDEEKREILLSNFSSFRIDNDTFTTIDNYENDATACIYIDATDIKRIEIFRGEPI